MITIDSLKSFGADTADGLQRCLNMESFYLDLVNSVKTDKGLDELKDFLDAGDLDNAFEKAHALKGMYGNLSLTPIYTPLSELTDLLRSRETGDRQSIIEKCMPLLTDVLSQKQKIDEM
ncbi:MAG: Hpt domain-containing protein [Lachnospiraceae bacterium]|nr:Hpt domain-containing protein [Lachnospiraceae bacterium]